MDPGHLEGGAILLVSERHVRVIDATEKLSGGVAGILVARLLAAFAGRLG